MRMTKTPMKEQIEALKADLERTIYELRLAKMELETIKKYTLAPVVSLQIALEKTTDCIAHVLTDMKVIKQEVYNDDKGGRR